MCNIVVKRDCSCALLKAGTVKTIEPIMTTIWM